ncbi:MAG: hypothetical protein BGO49_00310 [Planctomycetales bacterium 71-10]|nr:MAG: hypothetical protein BGO49_00310 [Planctomycetales bacterium 71-10]
MPQVPTPGTVVRLVQPVVEGPVKEIRSSGGDIEALVEYRQGGEVHERWFRTSELEEVENA